MRFEDETSIPNWVAARSGGGLGAGSARGGDSLSWAWWLGDGRCTTQCKIEVETRPAGRLDTPGGARARAGYGTGSARPRMEALLTRAFSPVGQTTVC